VLIGSIFFVLVSIAAWSSAISLLEPCVAWLIETKNLGRVRANLMLAGFAWLLGLGSVFSFNIWSEYRLLGFTFFDFLDFLRRKVHLTFPTCPATARSTVNRRARVPETIIKISPSRPRLGQGKLPATVRSLREPRRSAHKENT